MTNPFAQFHQQDANTPSAPPTNAGSAFDRALAAEGTTGPAADFARSIYHQESGSGANTRTSNAGATGGMQIIPSTFKSVADPGWDINNPEHNARAGIRYATQMFNSAGGDPVLAGAGYYGGPAGMAKARQGVAVSDPRNPNAPDTIAYGQQVAGRLQKPGLLARAANAVTDAILPSANAATTEAVNPFAQFHKPAAPAASTQPTAAPATIDPNVADSNSFLQNAAIGAGKALTDIGQGVGQRLRGAVGDSLGDTLGLPTQADVDEKRRLDAPVMATAGGKVGNFAGNAAPALATALIPGAQGLTGSLITGGILGAAAPTATGESVLGNTLAGTVGGGVGYGIGKGISRIVSPNASTNADLALLKSEGVQPTIGQTLGGAWNTMEQKLQSVPIMGDAITAARNRAKDQFNNAAINRATAPIGVKINGAGQDAVKAAGDALSSSYENALSQVQHVTLDPQFHADMGQLQGMAQNLVPSMRAKFNKTVNDLIVGRVSPQGSMLGDTYKTIDSELGNIASKFGKSQVASESEYGDAIAQLQSILKQQMMRSNPQVAQQLNAADAGWANLMRVEQAAKVGKNNKGIFTPGQLNGAVQSADDSIRGRAVARGTALMQDLGNAGQNVLGNNYPDSGTTGRMLLHQSLNAGAAGAYFVNPWIPGGLAIGAGAYAKPVQSLLRAGVSNRPDMAQPIAKAIANHASSLAPVSALTAVGGIRRKPAQ